MIACDGWTRVAAGDAVLIYQHVLKCQHAAAIRVLRASSASIPSFLIRDQSVERLTPEQLRRALRARQHAAGLLQRLQDVPPLGLSSVHTSSAAGVAEASARCVGCSTGPWHRMTARSRMFASSRTLPGQS